MLKFVSDIKSRSGTDLTQRCLPCLFFQMVGGRNGNDVDDVSVARVERSANTALLQHMMLDMLKAEVWKSSHVDNLNILHLVQT